MLQEINQHSGEVPATILASCCVRVMGLSRRASTMAEDIFLACLSSPYSVRMDARACWSKVFTTSAADGISGYLRTKWSPIKLLDVMSLLTVANPDNSENLYSWQEWLWGIEKRSKAYTTYYNGIILHLSVCTIWYNIVIWCNKSEISLTIAEWLIHLSHL